MHTKIEKGPKSARVPTTIYHSPYMMQSLCCPTTWYQKVFNSKWRGRQARKFRSFTKFHMFKLESTQRVI
jgi:hypothetical protein